MIDINKYRGPSISTTVNSNMKQTDGAKTSPTSGFSKRVQALRWENSYERRPGLSNPRKNSLGTPPLRYNFDSQRRNLLFHKQNETVTSGDLSADEVLDHEYVYSEPKSDHIRLMLLCRGEEKDEIHCCLKTISERELESSGLVYQALSYAWGQDKAANSIFLRDMDVPSIGQGSEKFFSLDAHGILPRRFYLRPNLFRFLKKLRLLTEDIWIWADAICIDQANDKEKTHQLGKMLNIYYTASNVCIWLGDNMLSRAHDSDVALNFVSSIINLGNLEIMLSAATPDESFVILCVAFAKLLRQPWFSRRWVIQEVSTARRASVHYGSLSVNWIDFSDAVELFIAHKDRIRLLYGKSAIYKAEPDALDFIESAGAKAIVSSASRMLRKSESGLILDRLLNMESLVMMFQHFDASDPRDTVYALLGLATDGKSSSSSPRHLVPLLAPDYTKDPVQVYMELVRHCIIESNSLDIICRHWALPLSDTPSRHSRLSILRRDAVKSGTQNPWVLPSWIGLVSDSPFGPPSKFTGRLNGDSLVGSPGQATYNASYNRVASVQFFKSSPCQTGTTSTEIFSTTLRVKGMFIGRVSRVTSRVIDGTVSDECFDIPGWNWNEDLNDIPDRLWKTLVADRDSQGQRAPSWYRRACMYSLKMASPDGDLHTSRLITNESIPSTVREFLRRVQAVVWNRKFISCGSWLFGLGPRRVQSDDIICLLFGCSVPVALRALGGKAYALVGECYIHGCMDGELLATMTEETIDSNAEVFDLV
ncbi:heterokaryon incompatibility protein-domain-containing protein [Xylariaceae sp. AK1471]|nr:heterokaryon incompatibility protein-domain-containing protein [Xylariaceae sp. AK1471]